MNRLDWGWVLTCFGTAVGAGILFLPIRAGVGGIWPTIALAVMIFPVTYVAHRGITRIVASCPKKTDIIGAVEYDLGSNVAFAVSILYFLSIISICIGYATGITNIVGSFMTNQLGMDEISRPVLTFVLLAIMTLVLLGGSRLMVLVTSIITFPLIFLLAALSLYMIPFWNLSAFAVPLAATNFTKEFLLLFPILVFAMNFSPVCSSLGAFYGQEYADKKEAVARSDKVIQWTALILLIFVMFFVFSMILCTSPAMMAQAQKDNVDVLTTISLNFNQPVLVYIPPIIAFLAIASSYFGHFTGTREGLVGIITRLMTWNNPEKREQLNLKKINLIMTFLLFIGLWFLAVFNPPILKIIGAMSAPIIAMYAYLMPVALMQRVPRLFIYRSKWGAFVFIMGIVGILGDFLGSYVF